MSALTKGRDDLLDAVSHEGVRTALTGLRVPRWETVHAIVTMLAEHCGWGGEDGQWTAEQIVGVSINPFNAVETRPGQPAADRFRITWRIPEPPSAQRMRGGHA
ncbi:hypothetical protein ACIGEZ_02165 [Streptomyces sp. NPDC085481]|uniref:hypothetical protein n=1 Tax=Streptomyces sp. NPDC085481 TaxID=3365727 RepID=UPI0037D4D924